MWSICNRRKTVKKGVFSERFFRLIRLGFWPNTEKRLFAKTSNKNHSKEHRMLYKTVLGFFDIVLQLRDRHNFMLKDEKIMTIFSTKTLTQLFSKLAAFFKKLEYRFLFHSMLNKSKLTWFETDKPKADVRSTAIRILN